MFSTRPLDDHTHGDILDSDTQTYDNIYDINFDFIQTNHWVIWRHLTNANLLTLTLAPLGMVASLWGANNKDADHVPNHWDITRISGPSPRASNSYDSFPHLLYCLLN